MRIIVKNLPNSTTKKELENHFSKTLNKSLPITDTFLLTNSDKFRRVCFIGYSSNDDSLLAVKYFNNTYFKNHKITVEIAREEINTKNLTETKLRKALYSKTIVIKGINNNLTESILHNELENFGPISNIEITDRNSAIVKFKKGEDAEKALKNIRVISGIRVKVGNFIEKIVDLKKNHYNSLFFNFETVIKRTCENEGLNRTDLLDLKDKSLGSKIAILETSLVSQTKKFLENNGIFLDKIVGTSENIVILRNSDLMGAIDLVKGEFTVNIAPSNCLALLTFKNKDDALKCYKENNMKRYKNEVIYCEFAPITEKGEEKSVLISKNNKIIVKNVPFQATQQELKAIFSSFANVVDVRLPVKADGTHRGFGFIILDSSKSVDEAIEFFNSSTHLYGRRLVLEKARN